MAVIGINYTGCNHDYDEKDERIEVTDPKKRLKYKSVYLHFSGLKGGNKEVVFKSGDFVKDWYDAKKHYMKILQDNDPFLAGSSSVHDFFMDGADFDSGYLHVENGTPILKYVDRTNERWFLNKDLDGWEFFVKEGTQPTWKELQILCGETNIG